METPSTIASQTFFFFEETELRKPLQIAKLHFQGKYCQIQQLENKRSDNKISV